MFNQILVFLGYIPQTKIVIANYAYKLNDYLQPHIKEQLLKGFQFGFCLRCINHPLQSSAPPKDHSPCLEHINEAWSLVYKEVMLGRIIGPYTNLPLPILICSLLNLVPKADNPGKFRLIHNLAYPYDQSSVNANIPDKNAKVSYQKFDVVIQLGLKHGPGCYTGKMDFDVAFCNIPIHLQDLPLLGFMLDDLYFINSTLAFGARSSCKIFEEFATTVQWILYQETSSANSSHYLDDFIMVHASHKTCTYYMTKLQEICSFIGTPLSPEKTQCPFQIIIFLGLTLNFLKQVVQIPLEKINKALDQINSILSSQHINNKNMKGKIQVRQVQQLTGLLNFICKAIPCGYPFLRRLYDLQAKALPSQTVHCTKPKPHYKIHLSKGVHQDLLMWKKFLSNPDFKIHREVKFLHLLSESNQGLQIFADAAGNATLGFGCIFPEKGIWVYAYWPLGFFKQQTPSISLLELYAIVITVEMWAHLLQGKQIHLHCNNEATVFCINKKSSKNPECMFLICHLTLTCMKFQIYVTAQHYQGKRNVLADVLSRGKIQHFHDLCCTLSMNPNPTPLPATLWPISWQLL